jgi:hypothetical protein
MEAGEYGPIAFKFMLVWWDETRECWGFQLKPSKRPIAQGVEDNDNEAMWIEGCPDVFCESDE